MHHVLAGKKKLKGRDILENLGVYGRIILKLILKKYGVGT
jgi:hypothetical protein